MEVKTRGPQSSDIVVITDWPDKSDLKKGIVFSGPQGHLFDKICNDAGVTGKQFFIYPIINCPMTVPKGKGTAKGLVKFLTNSGFLDKTRLDNLKINLQLTKPNVIICVGELALQILTGNSGVRRFMGSILRPLPHWEIDTCKVIPILHPKDIYRLYRDFYYTSIYIKRAVKYQTHHGVFHEPLSLEIISSYKGITTYARDNRSSPYLVTDIETYFNMISCIGISLSPDTAVTIPLLDGSIPTLELAEILIYLQKLYNHFPVVNQNLMFDHIHLEEAGFRLPNILGDTMLNASVLYPELPKNLGFLNSLYTEIPYFKDESEGTYRPSKQLYLYCGKDCVSTYRIYNEQKKELKECGTEDFLENRVIKQYYPTYKELNTTGIQIDVKVRDALIQKYTDLLDYYTQVVIDATGNPEFNPLSSKQCTILFYDFLELPPVKRRRASGPSSRTSDENAIEYLLLNHVENEDVKDLLMAILCCRKIKKVLENLNIPLHPGDIFRTSFNLAGTETGRTATNKSGKNSSRKSGDRIYTIDDKEKLVGTDLGFPIHNISKHGKELPDGTILGDDVRKMFVPRDGYVFVEGDQSKAEVVCVTVLSKDFDLYQRFYETNIHKETARDIFGIPIDKITDTMYQRGKRVRHAGNYDMGPKQLAVIGLMPQIEATQLLTKFH